MLEEKHTIFSANPWSAKSARTTKNTMKCNFILILWNKKNGYQNHCVHFLSPTACYTVQDNVKIRDKKVCVACFKNIEQLQETVNNGKYRYEFPNQFKFSK